MKLINENYQQLTPHFRDVTDTFQTTKSSNCSYDGDSVNVLKKRDRVNRPDEFILYVFLRHSSICDYSDKLSTSTMNPVSKNKRFFFLYVAL